MAPWPLSLAIPIRIRTSKLPVPLLVSHRAAARLRTIAGSAAPDSASPEPCRNGAALAQSSCTGVPVEGPHRATCVRMALSAQPLISRPIPSPCSITTCLNTKGQRSSSFPSDRFLNGKTSQLIRDVIGHPSVSECDLPQQIPPLGCHFREDFSPGVRWCECSPIWKSTTPSSRSRRTLQHTYSPSSQKKRTLFFRR